MGRIDFLTTQPHYADHLRPIFEALPEGARGGWYRSRREFPLQPQGTPVTVVAAFGDLKVARLRPGPIVYTEHGCGLSYSTTHPSYAGGSDRQRVSLFLSPNEYTARRNRAAHPDIPQQVVGCPKLDPVWGRHHQCNDPPVVVVSFHWDCQQAPESRSAYQWYRPGLRLLAKWAKVEGWQVAGHAHPRIMPAMRKVYTAHGIPTVDTFAGVLDVADCYVVDNSSTLYEFAATDRPCVVLNAPWYRRHVHHGLRFWENIPGVQVNRPAALRDGIRLALEDPTELQAARRAAVEAVYPVGRDGTAAQLAAQHLLQLAGHRRRAR